MAVSFSGRACYYFGNTSLEGYVWSCACLRTVMLAHVRCRYSPRGVLPGTLPSSPSLPIWWSGGSWGCLPTVIQPGSRAIGREFLDILCLLGEALSSNMPPQTTLAWDFLLWILLGCSKHYSDLKSCSVQLEIRKLCPNFSADINQLCLLRLNRLLYSTALLGLGKDPGLRTPSFCPQCAVRDSCPHSEHWVVSVGHRVLFVFKADP